MSKSFRDKAEEKRASAANPAMMFISQPEEPPKATRNPETGRNRLKVSSARMVETPEQETPLRDTLLQAKRAPQGREAKTRRLQLLLTPSLYEAVKERADSEGLSVNETISELLQTALRESE